MIVVATSVANDCHYCVIAHGAILRIRAKDPLVADQVAVNYRKADITERQKAMLDFAVKLAVRPGDVDERRPGPAPRPRFHRRRHLGHRQRSPPSSPCRTGWRTCSSCGPTTSSTRWRATSSPRSQRHELRPRGRRARRHLHDDHHEPTGAAQRSVPGAPSRAARRVPQTWARATPGASSWPATARCSRPATTSTRYEAPTSSASATLLVACEELMLTIAAIPQPVVARVHGLATAAGCQLVAACDLAVAADTAGFAIPGGKGGWFCHTPLVAVARNVGRKRAAEMAFTGDAIDAATALDWGLVNRVVTADELEQETRDLLERATRGSALSKATRQGRLLPPDRPRSPPGLRLRHRVDGRGQPDRGRPGGHGVLPGEASAEVGRPLS